MVIGFKATDLIRACDVDRWHTVNFTRRQSLAEHQYNVAAIAMDILSRVDDNTDVLAYVDKKRLARHLLPYALVHDIDEVKFGDIPPAGKDWIPDDALTAMAPIAIAVLEAVPPDLVDAVTRITKAADLIEGAMFSSEYCIGKHSVAVSAGAYSAALQYVADLPLVIMRPAREIIRELVNDNRP